MGKLKLVSWFLIISLFLVGCNTQSKPAVSDASSAEKPKSQTTYPIVIKDDTGTDVTITAPLKRIISFVPSSTETLAALGLEGKIVGLTKYDNYPQGIQKKVEFVFEDSLQPNVEQILKLNPDLIILGMHNEKTISSIRNLKIPVVVFNPQNLTSTYETIEKLGILTDAQPKAKTLLGNMKEKQALIEKKVSSIKETDRLKVWLEVDPNLFTAGNGTFLNELLTKTGAVNIAGDINGWGQYSSEQVIAKNPQVILDTYSYYEPNVKKNILGRSAWKNIDAVKNNRIVDLDSDMVTRPGPRIIDGLESIAKAIYPELFK